MPIKPDTSNAHTDTQRLDWLLLHNAEADKDRRGCYITAWVGSGAPGNKRGPAGRFVSNAATHRECIDMFLLGNITRID